MTYFTPTIALEVVVTATVSVLSCSAVSYSLWPHEPLPGFSVLGTFQEKILECVAISSSRESSWLWNRTSISCISFTHGAIKEALITVTTLSIVHVNFFVHILNDQYLINIYHIWIKLFFTLTATLLIWLSLSIFPHV